jgi:hypothetical protein
MGITLLLLTKIDVNLREADAYVVRWRPCLTKSMSLGRLRTHEEESMRQQKNVLNILYLN